MFYIKEMPLEDQPRNRLLRNGPSTLSNVELLAILLRTGYKNTSVTDLCQQLLKKIDGINNLKNVTIEELMQIKGIGKTKAIEIIAMIELSKRVNQPNISNITLTNPQKTYEFLKEEMQNLDQENLVGIYLNVKGEIILKKTITIGGLNSTSFHPREVLKYAIKNSAYAIILVHNHPSGDPTPSPSDIEMTNKIMEASQIVDILFIDHLIIGKNNFYSFKQNT